MRRTAPTPCLLEPTRDCFCPRTQEQLGVCFRGKRQDRLLLILSTYDAFSWPPTGAFFAAKMEAISRKRARGFTADGPFLPLNPMRPGRLIAQFSAPGS